MNNMPFQQIVPIPDGVALSCNGCGKMTPVEKSIHETVGRHGPTAGVASSADAVTQPAGESVMPWLTCCVASSARAVLHRRGRQQAIVPARQIRPARRRRLAWLLKPAA